jgi:tRNA-guanine family transglycosylase
MAGITNMVTDVKALFNEFLIVKGYQGTVKAMTPEEVKGIGAQIILGNTFHLSITPGTEVIKAHGDLHDFMHLLYPLGMGCIHQKS